MPLPACGDPCPDTDLDVSRLFRTHGALVRRALRRLGVAEASLEDAVQDVFVVLVRRACIYDPRRCLTHWLWGIARGVASTHRRSMRRRERLQAAVGGQPEAGRSSPENAVATAQARAALEAFLDGLDDDKCVVFVMAEIEGRTGPEIAASLDVNLNTVYARLRAARRRWDAAVQGRRPSWIRAAVAACTPAAGATTPAWFSAGAGSALAAALVLPSVATGPEIGLGGAPALRAAPIVATSLDDRVRSGASRDRDPLAKNLHVTADAVAQETPAMSRPTPSSSIPPLAAAALAFTVAGAAPLGVEAKPRPAAPRSDQDADSAAQVDPHAEADAPVDRAYIFGDDEIEGDRLAPDGTILLQRPSLRFESLINIRGHFVPELISLATDV